ncbi:MAG: hypothetical protein ACRCX2_05535, partial [Paraclostridium sp.]
MAKKKSKKKQPHTNLVLHDYMNTDVFAAQLDTNLGKPTGRHQLYSIPFADYATFHAIANSNGVEDITVIARAYRDKLRCIESTEWADDSIVKSIIGDAYQVDQHHINTILNTDLAYLQENLRDSRFNDLILNGGESTLHNFNNLSRTYLSTGYQDIRDYLKANIMMKYGEQHGMDVRTLLLNGLQKDSVEASSVITTLTQLSAESVENWRLDATQNDVISKSRLVLAETIHTPAGRGYLEYIKTASANWDTHDCTLSNPNAIYNGDATLDMTSGFSDGDDLQRVMECTHTQYISIVNKLLN